MILDQLIEQPMEGNAHEAINSLIVENKWGSRADQAWFPQGGKLFPEIGGGLQVPEGSGDIMNMLISMITGGQAAKGGQGIMNYIHNMKRAMKPIPKTFANPKGRPPVGTLSELPTPGIPRFKSRLDAPEPTMLNQLTKKKGTYYPAPGYKPKMGKSMEYAPGVNIARDPSTWTKEGERIIQQLLDMGVDIINK